MLNEWIQFVTKKKRKNLLIVATYSQKFILVSTIILSCKMGLVQIEQHIMDFVVVGRKI
jgi:hypothetical protein